jgi:hypothetical protein
MDRDEALTLLRQVANGELTPGRALGALTGAATRDLGFARLDTDRGVRTGDPEVIFGAGKTPEQTVALLDALARQPGRRSAVATRLPDAALESVARAFPDCRVDPIARCAAIGDAAEPAGRVLVVTAGTSDEPVAREAAFVATEFGCDTTVVRDVGVAGIHRVLAVRDDLDAADCLIVVAGMDGALPSVVAGLVGTPVVAVPTSVGYGSSFGGVAALLAMLNSCGPGVTVCNIDNGFGAAVAAARMIRRVVTRA